MNVITVLDDPSVNPFADTETDPNEAAPADVHTRCGQHYDDCECCDDCTSTDGSATFFGSTQHTVATLCGACSKCARCEEPSGWLVLVKTETVPVFVCAESCHEDTDENV